VLEIGATPDDSTLLNLPSLNSAREKIGINLAGASRHNDFSIIEANANAMTCFPDQCFDVVLCNAVFEHDPFFWKSLREIRRVTKSGGLVVIGVPGYRQLPFEKTVRHWLAKLPRSRSHSDGLPLQHSTLTLAVHNFPGDYYRFSEQAVRDVFFEGMQEVEVCSVLVPPRIIGAGIRP
jgi:ubiquinone/menaquinone biosynthesis C-methylase UbiE